MQDIYRLTSAEYHPTDAPTYRSETDGSFKHGPNMVHVESTPAHFNPNAPAGLSGAGIMLSKWIFNEESGKAEGFLQSGIELIIDSTLAPDASIGLHAHTDTEEVYYLLEGALEIVLIEQDHERQLRLAPGDAHLVQPGQSHFAKAGPQGARLMVIAAKVEAV